MSSNGLISFGSSFTAFNPQPFPISANVVAPYWDDTDTTRKGVVRFDVVNGSHPTLSCVLDLTNDVIRREEDADFEASWLLVARWIDVCPIANNNCDEVSIHNNVIISFVL